MRDDKAIPDGLVVEGGIGGQGAGVKGDLNQKTPRLIREKSHYGLT
ncbi:hypothetical protein [Sphingorhabdus sp.]